MYTRTKQYLNKVEHLFSFIQDLTACTASFAHGANDVSNAIGPYAIIYNFWKTGNSASSKALVQVWLLACGVMIVIGLVTYGYNIMKVLDNKITLHSPSRHFFMELVTSQAPLSPSCLPHSTEFPSLPSCASPAPPWVLPSATATSAVN